MKALRVNLGSLIKTLVLLSFTALVTACGGNGAANNSSSTSSVNEETTALQNQLASLQSSLTVMQTQMEALKNQSAALQNQVTSLQGNILALQGANGAFVNELSIDETQLSRITTQLSKITLLGHQPGTAIAAIKRGNAAWIGSSGITQTISYGPCTDMGVLIGTGQIDSLAATTENFRQCTGYEYAAVVETGAIAKPFELWFDGANCTGNMFEAENDGGYNRQALQDGVVFVSPIDGVTELMVAANQQGTTTTLLSNFSYGACNSGATEIQVAYPVSPNDLSITGVPSAVPANYIL